MHCDGVFSIIIISDPCLAFDSIVGVLEQIYSHYWKGRKESYKDIPGMSERLKTVVFVALESTSFIFSFRKGGGSHQLNVSVVQYSYIFYLMFFLHGGYDTCFARVMGKEKQKPRA